MPSAPSSARPPAARPGPRSPPPRLSANDSREADDRLRHHVAGRVDLLAGGGERGDHLRGVAPAGEGQAAGDVGVRQVEIGRPAAVVGPVRQQQRPLGVAGGHQGQGQGGQCVGEVSPSGSLSAHADSVGTAASTSPCCRAIMPERDDPLVAADLVDVLARVARTGSCAGGPGHVADVQRGVGQRQRTRASSRPGPGSAPEAGQRVLQRAQALLDATRGHQRPAAAPPRPGTGPASRRCGRAASGPRRPARPRPRFAPTTAAPAT